MKTDLAPDRAGLWEELPGGDRLWRLRIESPRALWVVLGFGTWRLQPGAEAWVYTPDRARVIGPLTAADVRDHGQLWLPPIEGDALVVEILWPASLAGEMPNVHLGTVSHGYRSWGGIGRKDDDVGIDAGACNIDVNCPLGNTYQDQKRGVVNLLTGGSGYCSGSLIATTAQDCRNLVLTAAHCLTTQSKAASTTFQFNFERPGCSSGTAPTTMNVTGSSLRATFSASDMTLLEMSTAPPESFGVFYSGWSRSTAPSTDSHAIHHPGNDEKKISYNDDPLVDGPGGTGWGSDHWRITQWEQGTTEGGSSGSPLFDVDKRIVGQLHGGTASCSSITWDEYGKLDVSWTGGGTAATRLQDWLDPGGTGAVTQDGVDATFCAIPRPKLAYAGHVVDDAPGSGGNGNGVAEPGETVVLRLDARNTGTLGATDVTGTLSTSAPSATVTDDAAVWGAVGQGATLTSQPDHVRLAIASGHACGDVVPLHLDLVAPEDPGAWASDFSLPTGTPQVATTFEDLMEAGAGGWTTANVEGTNPWTLSTAGSFSPTHAWFVADPTGRTASVLQMPTLLALAPRSTLTFQHRFNTEANWDGGVLEYSTNGTTWIDAGPLITLGAYPGGINSGASSLLAGRAAWSGDSGGWVSVEADLGSLAGADLRLRFRFASDTSIGDEGWYVDDVRVRATSSTCAPALAKPGEASDPQGPGVPLTIEPDPGGYRLTWSAPIAGGAAASYSLYRTALGTGGSATPSCEADLGSGTTTVIPSLSDGQGFLVVARNAAGEGSYGRDSAGTERSPATGGGLCP